MGSLGHPVNFSAGAEDKHKGRISEEGPKPSKPLQRTSSKDSVSSVKKRTSKHESKNPSNGSSQMSEGEVPIRGRGRLEVEDPTVSKRLKGEESSGLQEVQEHPPH